MKKLSALLIALTAVLSFAAKAPTHHSLRAESMGNAHVALVDDKDAIYFNYAGLSNINRLGNFEKRPEQGYYPRNLYGDMRLNLGGAGPFESYFSTFGYAKDVQRLYKRVHKAAGETGMNETNLLLDSLSAHPEIADRFNSYDHEIFAMKLKMDAELAFHGFGGAFWVDASVAPYIDRGIVLPQLVIDTMRVDGVAQAGFGFGITDNLSIGFGGKIANRQKLKVITVGLSNMDDLQDTLKTIYDESGDNLIDMDNISFGLDLGVLYQLTREFRLGIALNDIYFKELAGDKITPNLTVGWNYSPRFFNRNTAYGRKFNIAMDYANAFYSDNNYKPLSHINFGFELEQNILAWPGFNNEIRIVAVRLAGGFRGGYPSAGVSVEVLRFISFELATWAEEMGYYTGQDEERIYMAQLSLGF